MKNQSIAKLLLAVMSAGAIQYSCRPAQYEIVKLTKGKKADEATKPSPVAPPDGDTTNPKPPLDHNVPPTARVETILQGQSVTKVHVGTPVSIRPTYDTVDPDDIGKSACANPGIVKADYDLGGLAKPSSARTQGCESLATPYTFTAPGEYEIEMIVTSNEDETAIASMTLLVLPADQALTGDEGGFRIRATPMLTSIGSVVTFTSRCETKTANVVTWDFADGKSATGPTVTHVYAAEGQYRVSAVCTDANGHELHAKVTIVVIDKVVVIPGDDSGDDAGADGGSVDSGDDSSDGSDAADGGDPGQNPGQKPNQGPSQDGGSGTEPDQSPYDSSYWF